MFWILALLVLASGVGMGLRLGAIPSAVSIISMVIATWLASTAGKLFKLLLPHMGIHNPALLWMLAPICGFLLVYVILMGIGFEVHRRTYVYYKYKAGDLRLALWERLNLSLGGCLGVINGTAALVLISFVLFNLTYWTVQVAPSQEEPKTTRILNELGEGMQSTGFDKPARAVGSVPDSYYTMANFAGLLAQNPDLGPRLADYPAFISLTERSDVQQLEQESSLEAAWKQGTPLWPFMDDSQVQSMLKDTNLTSTVWTIIQTNMDDLTGYLTTGKSPKYDPIKIVGHWSFDLIPALADYREANPKITANDMRDLRALWSNAFAATTFVAGTDGQAFLKAIPEFHRQQPPTTNTWTGQWSGDGSDCELSLSANGQTEAGTAKTDGLRLTVNLGENTYVFERAD